MMYTVRCVVSFEIEAENWEQAADMVDVRLNSGKYDIDDCEVEDEYGNYCGGWL